MEELEKIQNLLSSNDIDNILIGLYIAENLLNKKDLVTLYYNNSFNIKDLIGNYSIARNNYILEKEFQENHPDLKYAKLFMKNVEIGEEDIKNWIYSASLKEKYKGSDGNYYWGFTKKPDYHNKCIDYILNNKYDFKRTDILTLSSICSFTEISYLIKDKELKDSDYYYIFTKMYFLIREYPVIDSEMFFYKVLNYIIDNKIIEDKIWYKLFDYRKKLLNFKDKCLEIEDLFKYLKYSSISRKHLNIVKKYYQKLIIVDDELKDLFVIKNGIPYKKSRNTKKVIWEEVRTKENIKLKILGKPKRFDYSYNQYVYYN